MSFTGSIVTGLLGYSLKRNFLGEGFVYREEEVFDYSIYAKPDEGSETPLLDIQSRIKSQFTSLYSGDVKVKVFEVPTDYNSVPKDSIRLGQFNVQVEVRKPIASLSTYMPELDEDYYKGFDGAFISANCNNFNDISEEFTFETAENGNRIYGHNLSFSLRTGGKPRAIQIASGIFANDKDTTLGVSTFVSGALLGDTSNYLNYFNESYDLIRDSFSFSKKREVLSALVSSYTYDLSHSMNLEENGIININEKGEVFGKLTFSQAQNGMGELMANSYTRCNDLYTVYKDFAAGTTVSDSLINIPITSNKTLNRPNLSANYEIGYSNNPTFNASLNASVEKIIDVDNDGRYTSINHQYNFTQFVSPVYTGMDTGYIDLINDAYAVSPSEITTFYTASPFYNPSFPTISRVGFNALTPNRKKTFSASFAYNNRPVNFVTIDSITYPFLDYKITDNRPVDIVTEYKIINRPQKTSLLNYAYQTQKGAKTIEITAKLTRGANVFTSPVTTIGTNLTSLYKFGVAKLVNTFVGLDVFSLNYHLVDVKYDLSSDNDFKMNIIIEYVIKKYVV